MLCSIISPSVNDRWQPKDPPIRLAMPPAARPADGDSPSPKRDFLVVVIGAGATGLLVAQGLKQANVRCRIFERDDPANSTRRPRDWSMGLHWGREYIDKMLPPHLKADLHTISTDHWSETLSRDEYEWAQSKTDMETFPMVNGATGEIITHIKAITSRRATRQKTKNLFSRDLDIEYGKTLERLEDDGQQIICHFADGSSARADAVIGSDSVKSRVRSFIMRPEVNRLETLPTVMYNFTQKYTAEQARFLRKDYHPVFKYGIQPELHVAFIFSILDVPDINDPESWTFQLMVDQWGHSNHFATSAERLAHLKSIAHTFCEPFRSAALWVKEDTYIPADSPQHMPDLQPWDNHGGRITLGGDAAHPMAPYRGQGLNNGLRDATNYVEAIKKVVAGQTTLSSAIDDYDAEMIVRGREEIARSAYQGTCTHDWDKLMASPLVQKGMHLLDDKKVPKQTAPPRHGQFCNPRPEPGTIDSQHGYVVWPVAIGVWACAEAALRSKTKEDLRILEVAVEAMDRHWNPHFRGYCAWVYFDGNKDIYYDDNAHAGNALVTAFEASGNKRYLSRAREIVTGILDRGWDRSDNPGGMMWHIDNKNTRNACSTLAAAELALRLALHGVEEKQFCRDMAKSCIAFAEKHLLSKEEGLVMDAIHHQPDGSWKLDPMRWTYNSGFGIHAWLLWAKLTGDSSARDKATKLALQCVNPQCSLFDNTLAPELRIWWDETQFAHHLTAALVATAKDLGPDSEPGRKIVQYLTKMAGWCREWIVDPGDGLYFRSLRPYFIDESRTKRFNETFHTHHTLTALDGDHEPGQGPAKDRPLVKTVARNIPGLSSKGCGAIGNKANEASTMAGHSSAPPPTSHVQRLVAGSTALPLGHSLFLADPPPFGPPAAPPRASTTFLFSLNLPRQSFYFVAYHSNCISSRGIFATLCRLLSRDTPSSCPRSNASSSTATTRWCCPRTPPLRPAPCSPTRSWPTSTSPTPASPSTTPAPSCCRNSSARTSAA
ncbi:hypothetical protein FH972_026521 [Carpinus fangiana]|uniref:FAD-binding domain-containing protein n=1 Tax=Carpinus fangiana TaxID=176857 RepID=A0A5N6L4K9_9ROSI|nr:hypothetical protein FH972_026521 [Carpinus fangiana]